MFYNLLPIIPIAILIICLIYRYVRVNGEATSVSGILSSVCVYMCIIPFIVVWVESTQLLDTGFRDLKTDWNSYLTAYLSLFLFVVSLCISYEWGLLKRSHISISNEKLAKWSMRLAAFTFIVGGLSFIIYAYASGGISELLLKAEYMRTFSTNKANIYSSRVFILVVPARLITVTPFLLIIYRQFAKSKLKNLFLIIASSILSALFLLSDAGKTGILVFGLCLFVPVLSLRFKHKWLITIIVAILCLGIVNYLDALFVYLANGEMPTLADTGYVSYMQQFSFPTKNLMNLDGIAEFKGYQYGVNYITGVLNIIPGFNFDPAYTITSEFHSGSNWRITGGIPTDAITFGFIQGGYFGVLFEAVLLGLICSYIDNSTRRLNNNFSNRVLKCTLVVLFFTMFINADMASIVRGQFSLIILSALVYLASQKRRTVNLNKAF